MGTRTKARRRLAGCVVAAALLTTAVSCSESSDSSDPLESEESLAGADADGNGVRDDVDAKVQELTSDETLAAYLLAVARNTQLVVTLDSDAADAADAAYQLATETNRLVSCPPGGTDPEEAVALLEEVQRTVANTPTGKAKLDELSALISGRSFTAPDCDQLAPTSSTSPSK